MARTAKLPDSTVPVGVGSGGSTQTGASVTPNYLHWRQDIVGVAVSDLEDFKAASTEEFWQFAIGQFFGVGGFWLAVERAFTVPNAESDPLFWMCVVSFFAGLTIGYFGYRQLKRRQTRMQRVINAAKDELAKRDETRNQTIAT